MTRKGPVLETLFWSGLVMLLGSMAGAVAVVGLRWEHRAVWFTLGTMFTLGAVICAARLH